MTRSTSRSRGGTLDNGDHQYIVPMKDQFRAVSLAAPPSLYTVSYLEFGNARGCFQFAFIISDITYLLKPGSKMIL